MKIFGPLVLLAAMTASVSAFPGFIVNSCERPLEIGEVIMGVPVAASEDADPGQSHFVDVVNAEGTSVCGTTVEQGAELTVTVDPTLAGPVAADGWTSGAGPNYIVESTNSHIALTAENALQERGCSNTRIVNPGAESNVFALSAGDMTVRLLSAYGFGQVWASEMCTVTVTGNKPVAQHDGYLVDNASWRSNSVLEARPYELTVEDLLAGADSGYSVLEELDTGMFGVRYEIDASDVATVTSFLEGFQLANETDIQVSVLGFESEDGASVDIFDITSCSSSATCAGFFSVPTDQVCIAEGVCVESSEVNDVEQTLTTTIVTNDDSWFGIGFTTPGGGMNAGGAGSDMFVCSEEGLRRFTVNVRANPGSTASTEELVRQDEPDAEVVKNLCVLDEETGTGRMTFTRTLAGLREIIPGEAQAIIYARGPPGEQGLVSQHPSGRRGEVSIDLTDITGGVSSTKASPNAILWLHIIFMCSSWGFLLPLAVMIANRCRNVDPPGTWFFYHKHMARIGWTLQTMGGIFAIYYAEVYSLHFQSAHTKLGLFVIIAGFFQPISAVLRPHPPKNGWPDDEVPVGRKLFEYYHKGIGWTAVICGMTNVFLGIALVKNLGFNNAASIVPLVVALVGIALVCAVVCGALARKGD